jgi:hypothetical protein
MSSLATARYDSIDYFSQQRKPEVTGTFSVSSEPVAIPRPEFAGYKVRQRGTTPVYVIDRDGYRRLVPFPSTFINLFTDSALTKDLEVSDMVQDIAEGPALDDGAILIRGISSESIYLLDQGKKRFIAGQDVMDKYGFNKDCVVLVQQILINAIPTGDDWE